MIRLLGAVLLALTACAPVSGTATPVATTSPRIDTQRDFLDADLCKLLTQEDFKKPLTVPVGGARTCAYRTEDVGVRLSVVAEPYEDVKTALINDGTVQVIEGHSVWWASNTHPKGGSTTSRCDMVIALSADHVLLLQTELDPANVVYVAGLAREHAQKVLTRMVAK